MLSWKMQTVIDTIRTSADLGQYLQTAGVTIPKGGGNALCPWHGDKASPSLHIYKDHAFCFGCGRRFDVFDAYQLANNCDWWIAVRELARELGVELPAMTQEEREEIAKEAAELKSLSDLWAALRAHDATHAAKYLTGRGLDVRDVEFAYWPGKFNPDGLDAIGGASKGGALLADCVVFPVYWNGRIATLTGRGVGEKKHRKLSRLTPPLFGTEAVNQAKSVVVCEGEIDTLTLRGLGVPAVGLLGAQANQEAAARWLSKFERVVLMLDGDAAGEAGTLAFGQRLGARAYVAHVAYPEGIKDPNDYLRHDADACAAAVKDALAEPQTFLDWLTRDFDGLDPVVRARHVASDVVPYLVTIPEIERAAMIDRLVVLTGLPRSAIKRQTEQTAKAGEEKPAAVRGDENGGLYSALAEKYLGLFYERNNRDGTVLTVWSKSRGESIDLSLSSPRQVMAALAPELGDVVSWITRVQPGVDPKSAANVLTSAMSRMVFELKARGGLNILAQGIHMVDGCPVMVDRGAAYIQKDGEWCPVSSPIVGDSAFIRANPDLTPWCPWDVEDINAPLHYSPEQALVLVFEIIKRGWTFRDKDVDVWIHTLLMFALPWSCLWSRKPMVHVRAPSNSGKSKLLNGLYHGHEPDMLGGLCPCSHLVTDFSTAGLLGALANTSMPVLLDEFESSEKRQDAVNEVLALLRASSTGGAGRLRGTKDLRARIDRLSLPVLAGSIEPIGVNDADANRWLVTELEHEPGHEHPRNTTLQAVREFSIKWNELKRSVALGLAGRVDELSQAFHELREDTTIPGRESVDSRFLEGILPMLAVAKVLNQDWRSVAKSIIEAKCGDIVEARTNRRGNRLLETLLATPITLQDEWAGATGSTKSSQRTTIHAQLDGAKKTLNLPEYGVRCELAGRYYNLYIYFPTALRSELFRGSEFATAPARHLTQIARDCDFWVGANTLKKMGAMPQRVTLFRVPLEDAEESYLISP